MRTCRRILITVELRNNNPGTSQTDNRWHSVRSAIDIHGAVEEGAGGVVVNGDTCVMAVNRLTGGMTHCGVDTVASQPFTGDIDRCVG